MISSATRIHFRRVGVIGFLGVLLKQLQAARAVCAPRILRTTTTVGRHPVAQSPGLAERACLYHALTGRRLDCSANGETAFLLKLYGAARRPFDPAAI